jgi:hypothetical protein
MLAPASRPDPIDDGQWAELKLSVLADDQLWEYRSDDGSDTGFAVVRGDAVVDSIAISGLTVAPTPD